MITLTWWTGKASGLMSFPYNARGWAEMERVVGSFKSNVGITVRFWTRMM